MTTTPSSSHRSAVLFLLWIAVIGVYLVELRVVEARRRDPLVELARFEEGKNREPHRRLTQQDEPNNNNNNNDGLLTKDSVRGTRSLAGKKVNVPVATSPDDHLVKNLPLLNQEDFPGAHWAGLLPVSDQKDGYLFYWLFAPDQNALQNRKKSGMVQKDESNVPLLVWLNGGPACSSMDGLWVENGPFRLDPKNGNWNDIKIDPTSWHTAPAYTLYIDQPVGTGLSFTTSGKFPNNDERVNEDFYYFLNEFMKLHQDTLGLQRINNNNNNKQQLLTLTRPFFFSGESHAGHYIPSMMNYIRKKNQHLQDDNNNNNNNKDNVLMPLSGAAIGNGWMDPVYQYSAQEAAYGYSLIDKAQERSLAEKEKRCRRDLAQKKYTSDVCFGLLGDVTRSSLGSTNPQVVSQYDARKFENRKGSRDFPPGHRDVEAYLGQTRSIPNANIRDVLEAIHAQPSWDSGQRYLECTDDPYYALSHQDGLGVVPDIVELLESDGESSNPDGKIKLLFFNGIHDLICNHVGNENVLENLPWKHRDDYVRSERYGWKSPTTNVVSGYAKEFKNLSFLKVMDAGHMVPMDVPEVALDMMAAFLYSKSKHGAFGTYAQSLALSLESTDPSCPVCPACPSSNSNNNKQDCPICKNNNDDGSSSAVECPDKCQQESQPGATSPFSSPLVTGIVGGVFSFLCVALLAWCCRRFCCGTMKKRNRAAYQKTGQIELSDSHSGGYRDDGDDDGDDYEEDGFDDEKVN